MNKTTKNTSAGIALGMCFGVSIGSALGVANDNLAVGMSLGISIGMALGMALGALKDKRVNAQLQEKGYTILCIEEEKDKKAFRIIIGDLQGEEQTITASASQMKSAQFEVDDVVFLNENGQMEQAFNKEGKKEKK